MMAASRLAGPVTLRDPLLAVGPGRDCGLCPRLAAYRDENRRAYPEFVNAPVASFGDSDAELLIVGLAPGLRGANRTGRPFTGDYAGDLLYASLLEAGFATGVYDRRPDDGLRLRRCAIANAVRCAPPQNKPTPAEISACRPFLTETLRAMPKLRAVLALGRIAHDSVLKALGARLASSPFAHGARHALGPDAPTLFDSYHCSRYNTNTGVLTPAMFRSVISDIRASLP